MLWLVIPRQLHGNAHFISIYVNIYEATAEPPAVSLIPMRNKVVPTQCIDFSDSRQLHFCAFHYVQWGLLNKIVVMISTF